MSTFSGLLWMFHRKQPFRRGRGTRGLHAWWALGQEGRRLVSAVWVQTWSCWASWFSRPSTIEANLSLLLRSAAIVMAAKILSKLGGEGFGGGRQRAGTTQKSTLLSPCWQDIYSQFFSSNTPYLISLPPCVARDICSARLGSLRPVFRRFQFLLCAVCSIVAKVTPDKDGTGDANAARLSRQRCRGGGRASFAGELRTDVQTRPPRSQINQATGGALKKVPTKKGVCQAATASKPVSHEFRHEKWVARLIENIPNR